MDGANVETRGPGKNKHVWSSREDEKLIEALLELHVDGSFNADNGFKPGYFGAVEKLLAHTLPNSGLKADPHIRSRVRSLKGNFYIVHEMLYGPNTSGFGWNEEKQCVSAETDVWNEYVKSHKKAATFKDKPFPHYNNLAIIFGKDRAYGNHAVGCGEAEEEIREEDHSQSENEAEVNDTGAGVDGVAASSQGIQSTSEATGKKKNRKRKRITSTDSLLADVIEKSSQQLGGDIKAAGERLSCAIEDATMKELKAKVSGELRKLIGLSSMDRHKAAIKIGCDGDLTMQFFTIVDEDKEEWIQALLTMG